MNDVFSPVAACAPCPGGAIALDVDLLGRMRPRRDALAQLARLLIAKATSDSLSTAFMVMGVVNSLLHALALGLIVLALLLGRSQESPSPR